MNSGDVINNDRRQSNELRFSFGGREIIFIIQSDLEFLDGTIV
jgi:hypothetical protein